MQLQVGWYRENKPRPFLGWGFLYSKAKSAVKARQALEDYPKRRTLPLWKVRNDPRAWRMQLDEPKAESAVKARQALEDYPKRRTLPLWKVRNDPRAWRMQLDEPKAKSAVKARQALEARTNQHTYLKEEL